MSEEQPTYDHLRFARRVHEELDELFQQLDELDANLLAFRATSAYESLTLDEKARLESQFVLMRGYADVLKSRLKNNFR